jgi:hypothetical protein
MNPPICLVLLTVFLTAGCGRALTPDKWVLMSYDDEANFMDAYVARDLEDCRKEASARWRAGSKRVIFECETGCTRDLLGNLICEKAGSNCT